MPTPRGLRRRFAMPRPMQERTRLRRRPGMREPRVRGPEWNHGIRKAERCANRRKRGPVVRYGIRTAATRGSCAFRGHVSCSVFPTLTACPRRGLVGRALPTCASLALSVSLTPTAATQGSYAEPGAARSSVALISTAGSRRGLVECASTRFAWIRPATRDPWLEVPQAPRREEDDAEAEQNKQQP